MKKFLLFTVPFMLVLALCYSSCQKEMSFERMQTAQFSFNGGAAACIDAVVSGTFTAGTTVTAANTVMLSVTVDSIGAYDISTNTANGISFSGSGIFTGTGTQQITLKANGTPASAGTFEFSPGANGCTFSVTVNDGGGGASGTAVYSFDGGTSSCTGATVSGSFTKGTALTSANTVVLSITVTTTGTYTISTNTVDGITFSGTGNFTATGAQTVTLTASGTPTSSGTFGFVPGAAGCTFYVTVNDSGSGSGNFLRCKIDGVLTNFNAKLVGYYVVPPNSGIPYSISVQGKNSSVSGSSEEFWVTASNPTAPTTGDYSNGTLGSGATDRACQVSLFPTGFPNLFWGSSALYSNTFLVKVSTVSKSGATGTFSGTLYENNGAGPSTKQVTEGEFKITF